MAKKKACLRLSKLSDEFWGITEIAENILVYLPMKDLLLAQRVSSGWRDLIKSSPVLQQQLFMRPIPQNLSDDDNNPMREYNPLLIQHMPAWFRRSGKSTPRSIHNVPWAKDASRLAFLRREASWRNMLLAQPPFFVYERVRSAHGMAGDFLSVGCSEQPDGLRMGLVYDAVTGSMRHGGFSTLLDGKLDYDSRDKISGDDPRADQRVFGGKNKFTLITKRTSSCTGPSPERVRQMKEDDLQFTSAGFEPENVVLESVERPATSSRFGWYTSAGYIK